MDPTGQHVLRSYSFADTLGARRGRLSEERNGDSRLPTAAGRSPHSESQPTMTSYISGLLSRSLWFIP